MEDKNDELNKKLLLFNKELDEALQNVSNNISQIILNSKNEIKERIEEKKELYKQLIDSRKVPIFKISQDSYVIDNYIINVVLFCLSNLEIITQFTLGKKKKDLLKNITNKKHFIVFFISLMMDMRSNDVRKLEYNNNIHEYLYERMNIYLNQDPAYIINLILQLLEEGVNLCLNNNLDQNKNIITKNFSVTTKKEKKCNLCGNTKPGVKEKKFVIDLHLRKPDINIQDFQLDDFSEELQSVLGSLLSDEKQGNCEICQHNMTNITKLSDLNDYLIFNLNRENDPEKKMKLKYKIPLKLNEEKSNREYHYELILALVDIDTNIKGKSDPEIKSINTINKEVFQLYFKNFINDKSYRIINGKLEEFNGDINIEISKHNPNILIYKRKN